MNQMKHLTVKKCTGFCLILLIIGIVYSNTLDADWCLDDFHNIIKNPWMHIDNLYPDTLKNTFFAAYDKGDYTGENLYRPAAMFSFAINWYFGKNDVTGYHLVNIAIHMAAAMLLFLSVNTLLTAPNVRKKYQDSRYEIALLAAVLWAVHPIQIQGVTYIVQRMASMAGMFYIAALYAYLKARLTPGHIRKTFLLFASLLLFALAVLSKQNAVLLPLILVVIEFVFFRNLKKQDIRKLAVAVIGFCLLVGMVAGVLLFFDSNSLAVMKQYSSRSFTLSERLMTEARVIFFYLYQLFYPVSSNYSITHDIALSTSLFSPWTTLPAIIMIIVSLAAAVFFACRIPVLSFAVLFFLINHIVESTIIPLELVFEHRNYIPSMFLFVPVAAGVYEVLSRYKKQSDKRLLFYIYALIFTGFIMVMGIGTYTRNMDWNSEKGFWEDALAKAPDTARPHQNLAVSYYLKIRDYDTATELFEKAVDLRDSNPRSANMISFINLSQIFIKKNDMETALLYAEKAVSAYPSEIAAINYISVLIKSDRLDKALSSSERFIKKKPEKKEGLEFKTLSLIKLGEFERAEKPALELLKKNPFNVKYIMYFGLVNSALNHYKKADFYLDKASHKRTPDRLSIYLVLINNSIKAGYEEKTAEYLKQLFELFTIHDITKRLNEIKEEAYPVFSISSQEIEKQLDSYLKRLIKMIRVKKDENLEGVHNHS